MRVAARGAVQARGALHWATRGRGARARAVRRLLATWRHVARAVRRARVQLHLAARYRKHRVQFAAFVALAHHGLTAYVSAHRLAHACLRWAGPPPSRAGQAQSPPLRTGQAQDGAQRGAQRGVPPAWGAWETGSACSEPVE